MTFKVHFQVVVSLYQLDYKFTKTDFLRTNYSGGFTYNLNFDRYEYGESLQDCIRRAL